MSQGFEGILYRGLVCKKGKGLINSQGKDFMDVFILVGNLQDLFLEALSLALRAGNKNI